MQLLACLWCDNEVYPTNLLCAFKLAITVALLLFPMDAIFVDVRIICGPLQYYYTELHFFIKSGSYYSWLNIVIVWLIVAWSALLAGNWRLLLGAEVCGICHVLCSCNSLLAACLISCSCGIRYIVCSWYGLSKSLCFWNNNVVFSLYRPMRNGVSKFTHCTLMDRASITVCHLLGNPISSVIIGESRKSMRWHRHPYFGHMIPPRLSGNVMGG